MNLDVAKPEVRSLFITQFIPYPPTGGAPLRNWQNINALIKLGPVAIFTVSKFRGASSEKHKHPPGVTLWRHHKPQERSLIEKSFDKLRQWLAPNRIPGEIIESSASRELEELISTFRPDIVIFEELWLHCYLPVVQKFNCKIILDEHNVEAPLYLDKRKSSDKLIKRIKSSMTFRKIMQSEQHIASKSEQVWFCSQADADLFSSLYQTSTQLCVVPNGINIDYYKEIRSGTFQLPNEIEQGKHILLFVGRYSYIPNAVAAELLIEHIYPRLKALYSDFSLILVGPSPTQKMVSASETNPSIFVTGCVDDVRPYLALSTAVIVPLLEGGGTRLKILEAFAAKRPVVSTSKGAEGLNTKDNKHLLIRNGVEDLVAGVSEIWSDQNFSKEMIENAYQLIKQKYSWEANSKVISDHLQVLQKNKS